MKILGNVRIGCEIATPDVNLPTVQDKRIIWEPVSLISKKRKAAIENLASDCTLMHVATILANLEASLIEIEKGRFILNCEPIVCIGKMCKGTGLGGGRDVKLLVPAMVDGREGVKMRILVFKFNTGISGKLVY